MVASPPVRACRARPLLLLLSSSSKLSGSLTGLAVVVPLAWFENPGVLSAGPDEWRTGAPRAWHAASNYAASGDSGNVGVVPPTLAAYWAKTAAREAFLSLPAHLLDVAAAGIATLDARPQLTSSWAGSLGLKETGLRDLLGWGLAIHDIGKFCDRFQSLAGGLFARNFPGRPVRPYDPHHTTLGSILLRGATGDALAARLADGHPWSARDWRYVLWALEPPFTGHHGQPPRPPGPGDPWDELGRRAAESWLHEIGSLFPLGALWRDGASARDVRRRLVAASWHFAGLAVQADWLGSNTRWFPIAREWHGVAEHWQDARERARNAVQEAGLRPAAVGDLWTMSSATPPRSSTPLQQEIESWTPGPGPHLVIMEDVTGAGKTEAGILAAHRLIRAGCADGLYFALPTQATANAMYSRIRELGTRLFADPSQASLVLAHSGKLAMREFRELSSEVWESSGTLDESHLSCRTWLADSRKKAFLAQLGVGTLDQALLGVLAVRHQSLRIFGLASRVLLVDEVHAYDPYASRLLETLLRFHTRAGGSTILLSATMPHSLRARLVRAFAEESEINAPSVMNDAYPLLTRVSSSRFSEIAIEPRKQSVRSLGIAFLMDTGAVLEKIREAAGRGDAVCWVRNTVADAMTGAAALADLDPMLLHARFTESDRREREDELLRWAGPRGTPEARRGRVVVATQVVEQSLDVDFDTMVTDLAPIELMLQRAGRLQRHAWRTRAASPTLHVHAPGEASDPPASWARAWSAGTCAVYPDEGRLWLSDDALRRAPRGEIVVPRDVRGLIEHVYGEGSDRRIPPGLADSTRRAQGVALAEAGQAAAKELVLDAGYCVDAGGWQDPDRARTRAGEPSMDVYLAERGAGVPVPLSRDGGWEGARVRIAARHLPAASASRGPEERIVILLDRDGADSWTGTLVGPQGPVAIRYSRRSGLEINKEPQA